MKTEVERHFDIIASAYDSYTQKRQLHYSTVKEIVKSYSIKRPRILEIGCGTGDVLAYLKPEHGYGVDISREMVKIAKKKYPELHFSTTMPKQKFDLIYMTDVVEHLENRQGVFKQIRRLMSRDSVFVNVMMNPIWEPIERVYTLLHLKMDEGPHQRIGFKILKSEVESSGMEVVDHNYKLLLPVHIPKLTGLANKYLEKYLKRLAFIEYFSASKV